MGKSVQGDECGWTHFFHQEPSALIRPGMRSPVIEWPLTFRTNRGQRSNEEPLWGGRGVLKKQGAGWKMFQQSWEIWLYCIPWHFLWDLTGECTLRSFDINIYAIQNDIKIAGVRCLNVFLPHSSTDQAQDEKCTTCAGRCLSLITELGQALHENTKEAQIS